MRRREKEEKEKEEGEERRRMRRKKKTVLGPGLYLLVPMGLGVAVQGREHDGQDLGGIVADEAHDVLIIPVI